MEILNLVGALLAASIGGYFGARASIRSQEQISAKELENQLRLAAVDRRLEVHQQAYTRWLKVFRAVNSPRELDELLPEAFSWWDSNCLYLSPDAAHKFRVFLLTAAGFEATKASRDVTLMKAEMEDMKLVGDLIQTAVGLPSISSLDSER